MARSFKSMKEAIESGRGIERPFNCPVHDDAHASASVNVDKGVWFCFSCRASGKTQDGNHDLSYVPMLRDRKIPAMNPLAIRYTNAWTGYSPYWAARYGEDVATQFATGTDPVTGMPSVPLTDAIGTTLYGFLLRDGAAVKPDPKYRYPVGVPVSRLLFGQQFAPANAEVLVLVEGASDVMSLHRWRIPRGAAVVGVYGAGLHAAQAELIRSLNPHRVVVAMDADDSGRKAGARSVERLALVGVRGVQYDWSQHGVSDPGEVVEDPWPELIRTQ